MAQPAKRFSLPTRIEQFLELSCALLWRVRMRIKFKVIRSEAMYALVLPSRETHLSVASCLLPSFQLLHRAPNPYEENFVGGQGGYAFAYPLLRLQNIIDYQWETGLGQIGQ